MNPHHCPPYKPHHTTFTIFSLTHNLLHSTTYTLSHAHHLPTHSASPTINFPHITSNTSIPTLSSITYHLILKSHTSHITSQSAPPNTTPPTHHLPTIYHISLNTLHLPPQHRSHRNLIFVAKVYSNLYSEKYILPPYHHTVIRSLLHLHSIAT